MSSNRDSAERPESPLNRPKRWLLLGGAVLCLISWFALGIGFLVDAPRNTLLLLATLAALASEGLIWLAAAILGVSVFQARRRIWGWFSRRLRAEGPAD